MDDTTHLALRAKYKWLRDKDYWQEEELIKLGEQLIKWIAEPKHIWFKEFISSKGMTKRDMDELLKEYPVFRAYYDRALAIQERKIVELSFFKKADSTFGKHILNNHHEGWRERTESNVTISQGFSSVLNTIATSQSRLPQLSQDAMTTIEAVVTPMDTMQAHDQLQAVKASPGGSAGTVGSS